MLIDSFTFFNELDLLELRLELLYPVVDKFILVEATKTQTKLKKALHFELNKKRYEKYLDKIIHVIVEDEPEAGGWAMENFQRNCITRGLKGIADNELIMMSDLDEIPNPKFVQQAVLNQWVRFTFNMRHFCYYANLEAKERSWNGSIFTTVGSFKINTPQGYRNVKDSLPNAVNSGWHFSWLGGPEKVHKKLRACIEPIDKSHLPTIETITKILKGKDKWFIHAEDPFNNRVPLTKVDLSDGLPDNLNQKKYQHLLI